MSSSMNRIASDLYKSLTTSNDRKPKPYDTKAEVQRVEGDTVWVKIPGGDNETPVQRTNNAGPGDTVMVRVSGGRAWVLGNNTNPATDDTRANQAYQVGTDAGVIADIAIKDAAKAQEAATFAEAEANRAHVAANTADAKAVAAGQAAATAEANAQTAITNAATAQTAADTAEANAQTAITNAAAAAQAASEADAKAVAAGESASAAATAASEADAKAVAAKTAADTAEANAQTAITNAAAAASAASSAQADADIANSSANAALTQLDVVEDVVGTLEWISTHATYKATADTEVQNGKLYFTKNGNTYTPVSNPTGNPSSKGYYEIDDITEAVSNYVSSHLSLTNDGLWVLNDNNAYKILLASDGMKVYDASGNLVATFGQSITFSSHLIPQYIGGENAYIVFNNTTGEMTIGGSKLDISGNVTIGGETRTLSQVLADVDSKVSNVVVEYAKSNSPTVQPTSGWSTNTPEWEEGKYIWQRTGKTINGSTTYTYTCIQGAKGTDGEDAVSVNIHSSNGMAFKNDTVETTLTVTIYYGTRVITDNTGLINAFGSGTYLRWKARLHGETHDTTIPVTDPRLSDHGFTFDLSPEDVNIQAVFTVEIVTPD